MTILEQLGQSFRYIVQAIFGPPTTSNNGDFLAQAASSTDLAEPPPPIFTGTTMPAPAPPNIPGMPSLPPLTTPISLPGMPPITVSCSLPQSALQGVASPPPTSAVLPPPPQMTDSPAASGINPYRAIPNQQSSTAAGV